MKKDVRTRHSCCVNLVLYLIGIILMPVGVVMTIMSGLGAGGYDAWNFALAGLLGQPVSSGKHYRQGHKRQTVKRAADNK